MTGHTDASHEPPPLLACHRRILACAPGIEKAAARWRTEGREVFTAAASIAPASGDAAVLDDTAGIPAAAASLAPHALIFVRAAAPETLAPEVPGWRRWPRQPARGWAVYSRRDYAPVRHAAALLPSAPAWVLDAIDFAVRHDPPPPGERAALEQLRQGACYLLARAAAPAERTRFLFMAQRAFFQATAIAPNAAGAYLTQARLWHLLGDGAMARRLLASLDAVHPTLEARALLDELDGAPETVVETAPADCPAIAFPDQPVRLLVILSPAFDPAADVLFDGLCDVLGSECVVDFPFKPSLHGAPHGEREDYPIVFDRPGRPRGLEEACAELASGAYAAVLFTDMEPAIRPEAVRALRAAAPDLPWIAVDGWDDCSDLQGFLAEFLGEAPRLYCKREFLRCHDYGPRAIPLPMSYPACLARSAPAASRTMPFFWAGRAEHGLRPLILPWLARERGLELADSLPQADYARALNTARAGLCLQGFGCDTLRYWELPAHGVLLVAEAPPLVIPGNFRDGEEALFFRDARELLDVHDYCAAHPERADSMAAAGHARFLEHHTGAARARQLLSAMHSRALR